jgi:malonyl-CoA/methylmalonyl-CoA synthetase
MNEDAFCIYTNGIDGETKGAVHTHRGVQASMDSLIKAWKWESTDRILNTSPMH